jgi:uncharacterized protein YndB with AHSA1/START domain
MNRSLVVEQLVPAEPARVYSAWTSAEGLAAWWWPQLPDTTYDVDARVGGSYLIQSKEAGFRVRGEFIRLDEPHEIGMTWEWLSEEEEGGSAVEQVWVRFAAADGGTLVSVTHQLHEVVETDVPQRQGWESVLGRLAGHYAER